MMWSCGSPHSSASSAERIALATIASTMTSRAATGAGRHGCRRRLVVDRDADELAPGLMQSAHLGRGRVRVGGIGIRHRLHDDRVGGAHCYAADVDDDGPTTVVLGHD